MDSAPILIFNSGGLRSLVATAAVFSATQRPEAILLHLQDGRPNVKIRSDFVRRQAKHFGITQIIELKLPYLKIKRLVVAHTTPGAPPLVRAQVLLVGLAAAIELGASRLIWPAQANSDFAMASDIAEQTILAQQLAQIEHINPPSIDTPLLDLSDQQIIELGGQMDLPWELAHSCQMQGDKPCLVCASCRRRQAAFEAAGMIDPTHKPATTMEDAAF